MLKSCEAGLWISNENKIVAAVGKSGVDAEKSRLQIKFSSVDAAESLAQSGFRPNVFCKILLAKNFRSQNIENKDLRNERSAFRRPSLPRS
jgi:hypothetical protein